MLCCFAYYSNLVAPARERGLKYQRLVIFVERVSRSREGAWIEMLFKMLVLWYNMSLP